MRQIFEVDGLLETKFAQYQKFYELRSINIGTALKLNTVYLIFNKRLNEFHRNVDGKIWWNDDRTTAERVAFAMFLEEEQAAEEALCHVEGLDD